MKRTFLLGAVAFATMSLVSCSKEETGQQADPTEGTTTITFSLAPDAGVETRAGRPLVSEEDLQEVEDMRIYVFKESSSTSGQYDAVTNQSGMETGGYYEVTWPKGTQMKAYTIKPKLAAGNYKFLAVGLDAGGTCYVFSGSTLAEALLQLNSTRSTTTGAIAPLAAEAFAGVSEKVTITETTPTGGSTAVPDGIQVSITLKRVVAGVLLHATNVPAFVNANNEPQTKYIAVALHENQNKKVNLTTKGGSEPYSETGTDYKTLFEVAIPTGATVSNGIYQWNEATTDGVNYAANSIGGGSFVLPTNAITGQEDNVNKTTLVLQLRDADHNVLKTWRVKVDNSRPAHGSSETVTVENQEQYPLTANHLYNIGVKKEAGTTHTPTDPDKPGDGDDDPIDLSKDQDIFLIIDPNWEAFHDMVIE